MYHFNPSCQMIETHAIVRGRFGLKVAKKKKLFISIVQTKSKIFTFRKF